MVKFLNQRLEKIISAFVASKFKSIINPSVQKTSIGNRIQNQNYGQKKALNIFYTMTKMGGVVI